ncbi:MAG: Eco57I restriction-modification methylase domain-containing protein, partial [Anaerolineae bacterium]|nr:Eco57I restriction-modification methylase domain-containing protein [Anaerolineae bacterium]
CVSANEGVMARLCLGLVEATGKDHFTEEERDAIYQDATYLLYRLLFVLYAEARGLLPMGTAYEQASLTTLVKTAHTYQLQGIPDPQATTLWLRLKRLCNAIYESDPELGIPAYNGGLFDDGDKPHLREGTIVDGHLTQALFDLAYQPAADADAGYRRINYRDLSVRHLGSIYEGMIEYKLQIAEETLWARRDGKGNVRFVRTGQDGAPRRNDVEIGQGDVYFSQNPGERRATGTYYTPEYVVDYIVRQTVIHSLEERRAPLEKKLAVWLQEIAATTDPDERERMQRTVDEELLRFVEEEVLTFRACDMSMGSGHFLVNTAHQITAFVVETLHLTPWENPTIDTDPVVWRRRIVEHCLYGVDLSLMAVELAKLSLWLASVAQDKPLSFLDHHLRQGNSLIGVRLEDLAEVLSAPAKPSRRELRERAAGQLSMLDDPAFRRHVTAATDLLARIAARVADRVEDVKVQEVDYEQVRAELEPYRRLGDLLVARHFGLDVDEQQVRVLARSLVNGAVSLLPEHERILDRAQELAQEWCFFHWELEFPEVFLNRADGSWGFGAIVGNPPYVRQERLSDQKAFFQIAFTAVYSGIADLYIYFIVQGLHKLAANGRLGMITANKWLRADYAAPLRIYLPQQARPVQLLDFGHSDVFPGTDTFPCILVLTPRDGRESSPLLYADVSDRLRGTTPLRDHVAGHSFDVPLANLREDGWLLEPAAVSALLRRLQTEFPTLGEQPGMDVLRGIITGLNEAFYVDTPTRERLVAADPDCKSLLRKLLRGRNIRRWGTDWNGEWMIAIPSSANRAWPWSKCQDERAAEEAFRAAYPALHGHLKPFEARLRRRQDQGRFWWELRSCSYYDALERPKIAVQQILYHSGFALDDEAHWVNQKVYVLTSADLYLLAVLNSRVMWWYLYRTWPHMKDEALSVQKSGLLSLPIPDAPADLRAEIERLAQQAIALAGDVSPKLLELERRLDSYIMDAFGLSAAEVGVVERTLPPRDPLVVLEGQVRKIGRAPTS